VEINPLLEVIWPKDGITSRESSFSSVVLSKKEALWGDGPTPMQKRHFGETVTFFHKLQPAGGNKPSFGGYLAERRHNLQRIFIFVGSSLEKRGTLGRRSPFSTNYNPQVEINPLLEVIWPKDGITYRESSFAWLVLSKKEALWGDAPLFPQITLRRWKWTLSWRLSGRKTA